MTEFLLLKWSVWRVLNTLCIDLTGFSFLLLCLCSFSKSASFLMNSMVCILSLLNKLTSLLSLPSSLSENSSLRQERLSKLFLIAWKRWESFSALSSSFTFFSFLEFWLVDLSYIRIISNLWIWVRKLSCTYSNS